MPKNVICLVTQKRSIQFGKHQECLRGHFFWLSPSYYQDKFQIIWAKMEENKVINDYIKSFSIYYCTLALESSQGSQPALHELKRFCTFIQINLCRNKCNSKGERLPHPSTNCIQNSLLHTVSAEWPARDFHTARKTSVPLRGHGKIAKHACQRKKKDSHRTSTPGISHPQSRCGLGQ